MKTDRSIAIISNSARKLPEYRREALEACVIFGLVPIMVDLPTNADSDAVAAALTIINGAEVYIGIFDSESVSDDEAFSELEYRHALNRNLPRLIFLRTSPNTHGTHDRMAALPFLQQQDQENVYPVETPKDLRRQLSQALNEGRIPGKGFVSREGSTQRKKGGGDGKAKDIVTGESSRHRQTWRVFVASPGDVKEERSRMPKVVDSLNKTLGQLFPVNVELWRWESDATAAAGEPQALINADLDRADVVVVIFWNRLGTLNSEGTTGTQSEVLLSLQRWRDAGRPAVMIYFCQRPARLNREELTQRLSLLDFRESIASSVLAVDYEDVHEFEWRVRDDLFLTISGLYVKRR
jgi:acyl-CoA synthetase (AMP-forming)/AMP-acid ligase II